MLGKKVVVLGGTGFVGRAVVNQLSKQGYQTQVAVKRPQRFREFALFPNTQLVTLDSYEDADHFKVLFSGADIVVNLVADLTAGTEAIPEKDIVSISQKIKKAVESAGVKRMISFSQIGADANNAEHSWLCDLGEADSVLMALANAQITILRSSLLLGDGDLLTSDWRKQLQIAGILPVANSGTQVQPLSVHDFAKALVGTIKDSSTFGKKLEVAGEERLTIKELAELFTEIVGKESAIIFPMCSMNAKFMTFLGALAPIKSVSKNQLLSLCADQVTDMDFSSFFGFVPKSIEQSLVAYAVPQGMRAKYHFYRQEASRNNQDTV